MAEFSDANKITDADLQAGDAFSLRMARRFRDRDQEVLDRMAKGGPPSAVGPGSLVGVQGDLVYPAAATISGLINCQSFLIHPNVVVSVDRFVHVRAAVEIIIHGHLDGSGGGGLGGVRGFPAGTDGEDGLFPGGGGGYADTGASGGAGGGSLRFDLPGGGDIHNPVDAVPDYILQLIAANPEAYVLWGAGGGGGGDSGGDGRGGRGGAAIILESPVVTISSGASVLANGQNGYWGGTSNGGGGGGAAAFVYIKCGTSYIATAATISAAGGIGGSTSGNTPWSFGGPGADGFVQVDVFG